MNGWLHEIVGPVYLDTYEIAAQSGEPTTAQIMY
jgi:hypothetical protein